MSRSTWDRLAAASGIGFAIAFVAAFLVAGDVPKIGDSARATTAWYVDNRGRVLVAVFMFGIALALLVWFVGTLAITLRDGGEGRPAAVVLSAGTLMAGFGAIQAVLIAGLAHSIADSGDTGVVNALNDAQWAVQTLVAFPAVVFVGAAGAGILRSGILPRWFAYASFAGGLVFALNTTTWARDGFWAPDGAFSAVISSLVFVSWAAVGSALLLQRALATQEKPMAAPLPA